MVRSREEGAALSLRLRPFLYHVCLLRPESRREAVPSHLSRAKHRLASGRGDRRGLRTVAERRRRIVQAPGRLGPHRTRTRRNETGYLTVEFAVPVDLRREEGRLYTASGRVQNSGRPILERNATHRAAAGP